MDIEMQGYAPLPAGTTLKDSLAPLLANDAAAISHNAGTAFPTDNLIVGMECYRTDLGLKHRLISINPVTWVAMDYLPSTGGLVGKVIAGWDAVGAPTLRVVDDTSGFTGGGLSVESNQPMIQFIDRTSGTGRASARLRLSASVLSIEHDDGTLSGTYTAGLSFRSNAGVMAVGGPTLVSTALAVRTAFTSQTATSAQYGATISPTFNESSTAAGFGLSVTPMLKATAFTMRNLYGVVAAAPQVQGNLATVQNYDAFVAHNPSDFNGAPTLITAAHLRFDTSAANTNKWNLYGDGSAPNYLNGTLYLGSTADDGSGARLRVLGKASFSDLVYARNGLNLEGAAANSVTPLAFRQNSLTRFALAADASGNLALSRYDDVGALIDAPLSVDRATGIVTFPKGFNTPGISRRNRVHNGRMLIMQRALYWQATSVNINAGTGWQYVVDRHRSFWPFSPWTGQQYSRARSDGIICPWFFLTTSTAKASFAVGDNETPFSHLLEANDVYDMQGSPITVSFEFISNVAGTFAVVLRTLDSVGGVFASCVKTFTQAVAGQPQRLELTFPPVPNGKLSVIPGSFAAMEVTIGALAGSAYACPVAEKNAWTSAIYHTAADATNWHAAANNQIGVTNLKLEAGPNATPGGDKSYSDDLGDCQRFAEAGQMPQFYAPTLNAGGALYWTVGFKKNKRAVPSVYLNNPQIWINGSPTTQWPGTLSPTTVDFRFTYNVANINGITGEGYWLAQCDL